MTFAEYQKTVLPQLEDSLKAFLESQSFGQSQTLKDMLAYHMGWRDNLGHGKRLRPLITLLCTQALGGELQSAMPAATAVEFLHNFTLIHDDIEDRSPTRHGRETLWMRWGQAQAINAGDALFSIAQLALLDLASTLPPRLALHAARGFNRTCLQLTQGQHLDIAFEKQPQVAIETYLEMIQGKTAALIAFAASLGGIISGRSDREIEQLDNFGRNLGLAFQVQDDFLGIWGDPEITGKSIASDLISKKKTLPVLFGLENCGEFRETWSQGAITEDQLNHLSNLLEACGAKQYVSHKAGAFTQDAFKALESLFPSQQPENAAAEALFELSGNLLGRES